MSTKEKPQYTGQLVDGGIEFTDHVDDECPIKTKLGLYEYFDYGAEMRVWDEEAGIAGEEKTFFMSPDVMRELAGWLNAMAAVLELKRPYFEATRDALAEEVAADLAAKAAS